MFNSPELLTMVFTGLCIGFGSAIGQYLATKTFIKNAEKIMQKMNNNKK